MASQTFSIRGVTVVRGDETSRFKADVVVTNGIISDVSPLPLRHLQGTVVDGSGLFLSPGFIDMHSHSDLALISDPAHLAKVSQGVTLEVVGQDGLSYVPATRETQRQLRSQLFGWNGDLKETEWTFKSVGEYLDRIDTGCPVNTAFLVPHGTVRMLVMGNSPYLANQAQLNAMKEVVIAGMHDGAFGLSAGLTYTPAMYSNDEELTLLCSAVASFGGYYSPHHRNYGTGFLDAVQACIEISRSSGAPLHLTHCHMTAPIFHGRANELLSKLNKARSQGVDISLDSYPYLAGSTYLHALLPAWSQEGGVERTRSRLESPDTAARVIEALDVTGSDGAQGGTVNWENVVVAGVEKESSLPFVGRSISEIAREKCILPSHFYIWLILEEDFKASCLVFAGHEGNMRAIMQDEHHMVGSDGILHGNRPHPRGYGTFARYLGVYSRDENVLSLEGVIARMTGRPARRLGLKHRGLIKTGMYADMVLFDYDTVKDEATYEDPKRVATGIETVWVNGIPTWLQGSRTSYLPGRALRLNRQ